jgi:hypothetical protein
MTMTTTAYSPDDEITIRQTLKRLDIDYSAENRVAFNNAINRRELRKVDRPGRTIYLRWGDVLEYMEKGSHHKRRHKAGPRATRGEESTEMATLGYQEEIVENAKSSEQPVVPLVDFEVVDNPSPVTLDDNQSLMVEIAEADTLVASLATLSADELMATASSQATRAGEFAAAIMAKGKRYLIAAWQCGTALNAVKAARPHGTFAPWLEEFAAANDTSVRTLQRFMKVAKQFPEISPMFDDIESLRAACKILGIAGPQADTPPALGNTGDDSVNPDKETGTECMVAKVLTSLSTLQNNLRLFNRAGHPMGQDDLRRLKRALNEAQKFVNHQEALHKSNDNAD